MIQLLNKHASVLKFGLLSLGWRVGTLPVVSVQRSVNITVTRKKFMKIIKMFTFFN